MKASIEYKITVNSNELAKVISTALLPDLINLPENCTGGARSEGNSIHIEFECTSTSKLRALNNSFIGVLLMLLEIVGGFKNE